MRALVLNPSGNSISLLYIWRELYILLRQPLIVTELLCMWEAGQCGERLDQSVMYPEHHKLQQRGIAKLYFFVIRIILVQAGVMGELLLVILFL